MSRATLQEAMLAAINKRFSEIHTCLPGKIEKYDHETQKASVKPLIKKKYLDDKTESLPVIVNVPVIFPRAKDFSFTFPIKEGDYVLLLFSERSLELFLEQGGEQEPGDRRKFDLSDAIAIPGLYPFAEEFKSKADNNDDMLLKFHDYEFRINKDSEASLSFVIKDEQDGEEVIVTKSEIFMDKDGEISLSFSDTDPDNEDAELIKKSEILLNSDGEIDLTINVVEDGEVIGTTDFLMDKEGAVKITGQNDVEFLITKEGKFELTGDVQITGALEIIGGVTVTTGDITVTTGDVVASDVSLVSHKHGGIEPGGGVTTSPI